jgi:hypothetical protein
MKLLFDCLDFGTLLKISSLHIESIDSTIPGSVDSNIVIEILSMEVYAEICRALNEGNNVFIPKSLDKDVGINDLIIQNVDDVIERRKNEISIRVKDHILVNGIKTDSSTAMLDVLIAFSELANLGYFVTENNRSEVYHKVIMDSVEKEDGSELIKKLENYLESVSRLNSIIQPYKNMLKFVAKLDTLTTIDQLNEEYENYMSSFA